MSSYFALAYHDSLFLFTFFYLQVFLIGFLFSETFIFCHIHIYRVSQNYVNTILEGIIYSKLD